MATQSFGTGYCDIAQGIILGAFLVATTVCTAVLGLLIVGIL